MRGMVAGLMFFIASATAAPLGAQVMLQPGAKVRITAPTAGVERFQGTVIATGDTIDVARGDARVRVPAAAVTRLELSRGKGRLAGAGRGALWGGGIGLALGAITSGQRDEYADCDDLEPFVECDPYSTGEWLAINTVGGAAWGALIGAIVGKERWDVIPVPGATRTSMTVRPFMAPGREVGLVVTLR
jgi:hypothetical protein